MNAQTRFSHSRQRGAALFVALFLITATAAIAAVVALTTGTQQLGSARALATEQAYYAALGRLELEIPGVLADGCPAGGPLQIGEFETELPICSSESVEEGGASYEVFTLVATASRGSQAGGTLVRRTAQTQITTLPE